MVGNRQPYSAKDIGLAIDCVVEYFTELADVRTQLVNANKELTWHKAPEELPPYDTEVVCKMKGVPFTEHFICKWDGKYWWHWCYIQGVTGWFGLNEDWEVVEWKEI